MARKTLSLLLGFCLFFDQTGLARAASLMDISAPIGGIFSGQASFRPVHLRYLGLDSGSLDMLMDKGTGKADAETLNADARKIFEYFLTGISVPESAFWVNLRPDQKERVIDPLLEGTELGRTLLEADLQLKKDISRFTSPDSPSGREYWNKLYAKAETIFGGTNVSIPTLSRPWIVPGEIIIGESPRGAYVYKATLKVMLEQDRLQGSQYDFRDNRLAELNEYSGQLIKSSILPRLTREINSSRRYASLRQAYYSMILAQWYKNKCKGRGEELSPRIEDGKPPLSARTWSKDTYFNAYKESFEKGEYNKRENARGKTGASVRTYFSGGVSMDISGNVRQIPIGSKDLMAGPELARVRQDNLGLRIVQEDMETPSIRFERDGGSVNEKEIAALKNLLLEKELTAEEKELLRGNRNPFTEMKKGALRITSRGKLAVFNAELKDMRARTIESLIRHEQGEIDENVSAIKDILMKNIFDAQNRMTPEYKEVISRQFDELTALLAACPIFREMRAAGKSGLIGEMGSLIGREFRDIFEATQAGVSKFNDNTDFFLLYEAKQQGLNWRELVEVVRQADFALTTVAPQELYETVAKQMARPFVLDEEFMTRALGYFQSELYGEKRPGYLKDADLKSMYALRLSGAKFYERMSCLLSLNITGQEQVNRALGNCFSSFFLNPHRATLMGDSRDDILEMLGARAMDNFVSTPDPSGKTYSIRSMTIPVNDEKELPGKIDGLTQKVIEEFYRGESVPIVFYAVLDAANSLLEDNKIVSPEEFRRIRRTAGREEILRADLLRLIGKFMSMHGVEIDAQNLNTPSLPFSLMEDIARDTQAATDFAEGVALYFKAQDKALRETGFTGEQNPSLLVRMPAEKAAKLLSLGMNAEEMLKLSPEEIDTALESLEKKAKAEEALAALGLEQEDVTLFVESGISAGQFKHFIDNGVDKEDIIFVARLLKRREGNLVRNRLNLVSEARQLREMGFNSAESADILEKLSIADLETLSTAGLSREEIVSLASLPYVTARNMVKMTVPVKEMFAGLSSGKTRKKAGEGMLKLTDFIEKTSRGSLPVKVELLALTREYLESVRGELAAVATSGLSTLEKRDAVAGIKTDSLKGESYARLLARIDALDPSNTFRGIEEAGYDNFKAIDELLRSREQEIKLRQIKGTEARIESLARMATDHSGQFTAFQAVNSRKDGGIEQLKLEVTGHEIKFGTSGWRHNWIKRDENDVEPQFKVENIRRAAQGVAEYYKADLKQGAILVGFDPRGHNAEWAKEIASVLSGNGIPVEILLEEPAPTPVLAWLAHSSDGRISGVINLTASHNKFSDDGFKFSPWHGGAAPKEVTDAISAYANKAEMFNRMDYETAKSEGMIKELALETAIESYMRDYLIKTLNRLGAWNTIIDYIKGRRDFHLFLDPMQGTGVKYMETLFGEMEKEVGRKFYTLIHTNNRDNRFTEVNNAPNPTEKDNIKPLMETISGEGAFGLATDGDADRFGIIDFGKQEISANDFMALALHFLAKKGYTGAVGKTVATSNFVNAVADHFGLELVELPVGFKWFVEKAMSDKTEFLVCGEESAHVGAGPFLASWDDGIAMDLLALWILADSGSSLSGYKETVEKEIGAKFFYKRESVKLNKELKAMAESLIKTSAAEKKAGKQVDEMFISSLLSDMGVKAGIREVNTSDGLKVVFDNGDWFCIRLSGTEDVARLYVEVLDLSRQEELTGVGQRVLNRDGGMEQDDKFGGIDLRSLPAPLVLRADQAVTADPAGRVAVEELARQWLGMKKELDLGQRPLTKLKELLLSVKRSGDGELLKAISYSVASILRKEEDEALETSAQMKEVLTTLF